MPYKKREIHQRLRIGCPTANDRDNGPSPLSQTHVREPNHLLYQSGSI